MKKNVKCPICGRISKTGMSADVHNRMHSAGLIDNQGHSYGTCSKCKKKLRNRDFVTLDTETGKLYHDDCSDPKGLKVVGDHSIGVQKEVTLGTAEIPHMEDVFPLVHEKTDEEKYILIMRWLYCNDKKFDSADHWRRELIDYIAEVLGVQIES